MALCYREGTSPPVGTEPLSVISAVIWNKARHPVPAANTMSTLLISTVSPAGLEVPTTRAQVG